MAQAGEIIAKLRLDIADYQKNIDNAKSELDEFAGGAQKMTGIVVGALVAVGTAMAGVATAGSKMAVEQEQALARVQAQTAMTNEEMKAFKDTADNLFVNGRGSYEDIYDTLSQVKTVLGETGKEAEQSAESALLLSEIFGYDVAESLRAVDSANKAWGGSSADTFDLITALSQQAGDKADDLLDTFWEYSPVMAEAGFSAEQFGDILNTGMEKGAFNFDKIGDALKEFNVRLTDGSTQANGMAEELFGSASASEEFFASISSGELSTADAMSTITGLLGDIEDPIKRNTLGVAFFGTMWEDLGAEVMLAMGNAEGSLENVEGAMANAGQALDDNIGTKISKIGIQIQFWMKEIGEQLLPKLTEVVDNIIDVLPRVLDAIGPAIVGFGNMILSLINGLVSLTRFIGENKEAFTILAGVITGLLFPAMVGYASNAVPLVLNAIKAQIGGFIGLIAKYTQAGLSLMGLSTKMVAIFGVIGALIAIGLLLWQNWDKVVAKLAEWGITSESVMAVLNRLGDAMKALWDSFKNSAVVQGAISMFQSFGQVASKAFQGVGEKVGELGGKLGELVSGGVARLREGWSGLNLEFLSFGNISATLSGLLSQLGNSVSNLWNAFTGSVIFEVVGDYVSNLIGNFTNLYDAIKTVISSGDFTPLLEAVQSFIPALIGLFLSGPPKLFFVGANMITAIADGMGLTVPELFELVTNTIVSLIEQFAVVFPQMVETGANMLIAIIEGIVGMIPMIADVVVSIIEAYVGMLTTFLPIILETGISMMMMIVEGILTAIPMLLNVVLTLLNTFIETFVTLMPILLETGISILMALIDGILSALPMLIEVIITLITTFVEMFTTMLPVLIEMGISILTALIQGIMVALPAIIGAILLVITTLMETLVTLLPQIIDGGIQILMALIGGLIQALPMLIEAILMVITTLLQTIITMIPLIIEAGIKILMALIQGIIQILPQLIETAVLLITSILQALIGALPQIIDAGIQILMALISGILQILPQLIQAGLTLIVSLVGAIIGALPQIISAGVQILMALISGILQIVGMLISTIWDIMVQLVSTILENIPAILSAGVDLIVALVDGILSMVGSVISAMADIGSSIMSEISSISLVDIGSDLIRGLWNGISNMAGWIGNKIAGFASGLTSDIKSFFGIHSPSRLFRDEIGVMLVRGLNVGIDKMKNLPVKTMTGIANDVVGTFDNLGSIDVAPKIAGLSESYVDVSKHVEVSGIGGDGGTNYNAPIVQVENMNVRDDSDVRSVSRELFNLQRSKDRSKGGR